MTDYLCRRDWPRRPPSTRKDGEAMKTNRYPTTCHQCGDALQPGEAMAGGFDEATRRILWCCGPGRWDRP